MEERINLREEIFVSGVYATCVEIYRDVIQMKENSVFDRRIKILQTQRKNRQMYVIAKVVSDYFMLPAREVVYDELECQYIEPRQLIIFLYKELTDLSVDEIATFLHISDHSAIFRGYYKISEELSRNQILRSQVCEITEQIEKIIK